MLRKLIIILFSLGVWNSSFAQSVGSCRLSMDSDYKNFLLDLGATVIKNSEMSRKDKSVYLVAQALLQHKFVKSNWKLIGDSNSFPMEQMVNILLDLRRRNTDFSREAFGTEAFLQKIEQSLLVLNPEITEGLVDRSSEVPQPKKEHLSPELIADRIRNSTEEQARIGDFETIRKKLLSSENAGEAVSVDLNVNSSVRVSSFAPVSTTKVASSSVFSNSYPVIAGIATVITPSTNPIVNYNEGAFNHPTNVINAFLQGKLPNTKEVDNIDFILEMLNLHVAALEAFDMGQAGASLESVARDVANIVYNNLLKNNSIVYQGVGHELDLALKDLFLDAEARTNSISKLMHRKFFNREELLDAFSPHTFLSAQVQKWDLSKSQYPEN